MSTPGTYRLQPAVAIVLLLELVSAVVLLGGWWLLDREVPAFRLARPTYMLGLIAGPVLALVFLLHLAWRNKALRRFAQHGTLEKMVPGTSTLRTVVRFLLFRHGLAAVVVAIAGPQFGMGQAEVRSSGIDLMLAVDVSNSMDCEDLRPNRMEAARRAMEQLIDKLRGDRVGIVVFAGEAFVQLPITNDRSAAKLFLHTVNTGSVGTQGTAIGSAIELAQESFDPHGTGSKAIIVITDGENHEDDAEGAARAAQEAGIIVHTIGMGTPQGGPLPLKRNGQLLGFRKDIQGNTVVSRLNEPMLQRIAAAGGGTYLRATGGASGMEQLVDELRHLEGSERIGSVFTVHEDQFQYPLGLGLLAIFASLLFGERRHRNISKEMLRA